MTIHWIFVALAAALLWPPLPLSDSLRKCVLSPRRNASATLPSMMRCWQNWADLLRGIAGAYVLTALAITADPTVKGAASKALLLHGVVLCVGVAFQFVRFGRAVQLVAPVFYLSGVTLILGEYVQGGFAVFVGGLFAIGGKRPVYHLPLMGLALIAIGFVLDLTLSLSAALACGLILLPLLLGFLFQRPLAFVAPERRMVSPETPPKDSLNPASK